MNDKQQYKGLEGKNKDYCCKALTLEVELHIPVWQI